MDVGSLSDREFKMGQQHPRETKKIRGGSFWEATSCTTKCSWSLRDDEELFELVFKSDVREVIIAAVVASKRLVRVSDRERIGREIFFPEDGDIFIRYHSGINNSRSTCSARVHFILRQGYPDPANCGIG